MEYKYDVAFSFAGENRTYVEALAEMLRADGIKVFYDGFESANLWGKDLAIEFEKIYTEQSRFIIPFISEYYAEKCWPRYEIRNAISKAIKQKEEYILPVRFDNTKIEGLRDTIQYLDLVNLSKEEVVKFLKLKLGYQNTAPQTSSPNVSGIISIETVISFDFPLSKGKKYDHYLKVNITNKLNNKRYYKEPFFNIVDDNDNFLVAFQLINPFSTIHFPKEMEYGEQISLSYHPGSDLHTELEKYENAAFMKAVVFTTLDEKYYSNKLPVSDFKSFS